MDDDQTLEVREGWIRDAKRAQKLNRAIRDLLRALGHHPPVEADADELAKYAERAVCEATEHALRRMT